MPTKFLAACMDGIALLDKLLQHPRRYDAIITDPPFSNARASRAKAGTAKREMADENVHAALPPDRLNDLLAQLARRSALLLKPGGHLLVFGDWSLVCGGVPIIVQAGFKSRNAVIWDKTRIGTGYGFRAQHEYILHFTFNSPKFHHQGTPSVLAHPRVKSKHRVHENQKPVKLVKRLVEFATPPGGWVIDPFAGSFSTGFACHFAGRNFVGSDLNRLHVDRAIDRHARLSALQI